MTQEKNQDGVALAPNHNADQKKEIGTHIKSEVLNLYDVGCNTKKLHN